MSEAAPLVRVERHGEGGHVAELVLDRPEAMNAVSTAMAAAISEATSRLGADETVRAVVVSSTHERAFCVGADLKERNTLTDEQLRAQRPLARAAYGGVLALPVPVLAAVDGYALGGGLEIALSCDLIVAGEGAVVGLPEVSVGVIPGGGGTQLLTRRVGWSRAASMIFTAAPADRGRGARPRGRRRARRRRVGSRAGPRDRHDDCRALAGGRAQREARHAPGLRHRPGLGPRHRGRVLGRHGLLRRPR